MHWKQNGLQIFYLQSCRCESCRHDADDLATWTRQPNSNKHLVWCKQEPGFPLIFIFYKCLFELRSGQISNNSRTILDFRAFRLVLVFNHEEPWQSWPIRRTESQQLLWILLRWYNYQLVFNGKALGWETIERSKCEMDSEFQTRQSTKIVLFYYS